MNQSNIYKKILEELDKPQNDKILIIDGMNTFLRSFSIVPYNNPDGDYMGGILGFLKSIGYAIKLFQPSKIIIVFDGEENSTNRKYLYSDYKGNRNTSKINNWKIFSSKDDEIESMSFQLKKLIEYLKLLPLDIILINKYEADDIISYINSYYLNNSKNDIIIMSADKDFLQLTSERTHIYSPTKKKTYNINEVLKEFEIHPNNFINYKVLLGDKSDNIPGIMGLGHKKLLKYFPEFKDNYRLSLEEIIKKCILNQNNGNIYSKIKIFESQLKLNYQLMDLSILNIFEDDKTKILDIINSIKEYNINLFLELIIFDRIDEKTDWVKWGRDVFSYLNLKNK